MDKAGIGELNWSWEGEEERESRLIDLFGLHCIKVSQDNFKTYRSEIQYTTEKIQYTIVLNKPLQ